jgi:hypothetical protein
VDDATRRWRLAYDIGILNAFIFLALSWSTWELGIHTVALGATLSLLFFAGSLVSFALLIRQGGVLAPITFYILGTGFFFGFGTYVATSTTDWLYYAFFPPSEQRRMLPTINVMNSLSVFLTLAFARAFCRQAPLADASSGGLSRGLELLEPLRNLALFAAVPYILVQLVTFPVPTDLTVRALIGYTQGLVYCGLLLSGVTWSRCSLGIRIMAVGVTATLTLIGFLLLSKLQSFIPVGALTAGFLLDRKQHGRAVVVALFSVAAYLFIVAPVVSHARIHPGYHPAENSISDRYRIAQWAWEQNEASSDSGRSSNRFLTRFSATPIQSFLINQHDSGNAGQTIANGWIALIPRVLWPEKPTITSVGTDLDSAFFRRSHSSSALAPTYTAEAYWNGGWTMVILVSALLALELGWLTRKWIRFTHDASSNIGIFVFAMPALLFALWVEAWIVPSYIGAFVTLVVLIKACDIGGRVLLHRSAGPQSTVRPAEVSS